MALWDLLPGTIKDSLLEQNNFLACSLEMSEFSPAVSSGCSKPFTEFLLLHASGICKYAMKWFFQGL